jgi:hypothetical protein
VDAPPHRGAGTIREERCVEVLGTEGFGMAKTGEIDREAI